MADLESSIRYWTKWQFPVCAVIVVAPAFASAVAILRSKSDPIAYSDLWKPCWKRVHPLWLLVYRALACSTMSYLLFEMLLFRGFRAFYFYTEWTFALVSLYFLLATMISAHGCWIYSRRYNENEELVKRLLERDFEANLPENLACKRGENCDTVELQNFYAEVTVQIAGFWGYTMQIIYQDSAGAALLSDIIFWCLLVPFGPPGYLRLNPFRACLHSLNLVFLLFDTALNRLRFPFFRIGYFIMWTFLYVLFQWILHVNGSDWWPYPFLDLATPWAPLWYLSIAIMHIPCFGVYCLIVKMKNSVCTGSSSL